MFADLWQRYPLAASLLGVTAVTPESVLKDVSLAVALAGILQERYPEKLPFIALEVVRPPVSNNGWFDWLPSYGSRRPLRKQLAGVRVGMTLDGISKRFLTGSDFYDLYDLLVAAYKCLLKEQRNLVKRSGADRADECCICFQRGYDTVLPCTHAFCSTCISSWARHHPSSAAMGMSCPMCRVAAKCHTVRDSDAVILDDSFDYFTMNDEDYLDAMIQSINAMLSNFLLEHHKMTTSFLSDAGQATDPTRCR